VKPGEIKKLTKALGAPYLDLIPPDQHKWQMDSGNPPLHRIWSWLCAHTIHWNGQQRNAWAIDKENNDLFLEHLAKDLWGPGRGNLENARGYWNEGKARGLWRNGTKEEGRRRLYLCGEVTPVQPELAADPENSMYILVPDQILKKTKDWPPEKLAAFRTWYSGWAPTRKEVRDTAIAELVGVARSILDRDDDSALLTEWGIPANRQEHKNGKSPEEAAARQARLDAIQETIDQYVHTVSKSVQASKNTPYNVPVQGEKAVATLSPSENSQKAGRESLSDSESGHQSRTKTFPDGVGSAANQLPVPPPVAPKKREPEEPPVDTVLTSKDAAVFGVFSEWQRKYKACDFGEAVDLRNKGQIVSVRALIEKLGGDLSFFAWAEKGKIPELSRRSMGKRAGPGGRFLGLVMEWAEDFIDAAPERARKDREKREAFARAAENSQELNKHLKQEAIKAALAELKDPTSTDEGRAAAREVLDAHGIQSGMEEGKGAGHA
jgi:hypothetical protein